MDLCCRLHRLRSLEEEAPSSLDVEPDKKKLSIKESQQTYVIRLGPSAEHLPEDTRRCSLGEPYLGEQQGLSMRLCTLSSEVEICRARAEASGEVVVEVGRGDQALECSPAPRLPGMCASV